MFRDEGISFAQTDKENKAKLENPCFCQAPKDDLTLTEGDIFRLRGGDISLSLLACWRNKALS